MIQLQIDRLNLDIAAVDCGFPVTPDGATVIAPVLRTSPTDTDYKSHVTYECITGYSVMEGNDTIVCLSNGTWSNHPVCHGKKDFMQHLVSVKTFTCFLFRKTQ